MKKKLFSIGMVLSMMLGVAFSFIPQNARANVNPGGVSCDAGGIGATACTATVSSPFGEVSVSVTCGEGYYACCNNSVTASAKCYENPA